MIFWHSNVSYLPVCIGPLNNLVLSFTFAEAFSSCFWKEAFRPLNVTLVVQEFLLWKIATKYLAWGRFGWHLFFPNRNPFNFFLIYGIFCELTKAYEGKLSCFKSWRQGFPEKTLETFSLENLVEKLETFGKSFQGKNPKEQFTIIFSKETLTTAATEHYWCPSHISHTNSDTRHWFLR